MKSFYHGLIDDLWFDKRLFLEAFPNNLTEYDMNSMEYITFIHTVLNNLNKHAPLKKMYLIANHSKFITKELSKEIMKRSKLTNCYLKSKTETARLEYKKQRNLCVTLLKKSEKKLS